MPKYNIVYRCGCKESIHTIPDEQRIAYLEAGVCMECYKYHAREAISSPDKPIDLPQLSGSEKEVSWANNLRIHKLSEIEEYLAQREQDSDEYRRALMAVDEIQQKTNAKQWIMWRLYSPAQIIRKILETMMAVPTAREIVEKEAAQTKEEAIKRAALAEATLRPECAVSNIVAEIYIEDNIISVYFPKPLDSFNTIVRGMGYAWKNGMWKRAIDKFAGTAEDRAAELGHTLLANGFFVRIFDELLRLKVIQGDFEPEQTRWIMKRSKGDYAGWFAIRWGSGEDFYDAARRITDSRYSAPNVVVPPEQFEQVLDFAEQYNFKLSEGAQNTAQEARKAKESMLLVQARPRKAQKVPVPTKKPPVLSVPASVKIDEELRDE